MVITPPGINKGKRLIKSLNRILWSTKIGKQGKLEYITARERACWCADKKYGK